MDAVEIRDTEARVNITYAGETGDLPDPVPFNAGEVDIKRWVKEAIENGGVPGIPRQDHVNLDGYVIEQFRANEGRPYNTIMVRPKTPFGVEEVLRHLLVIEAL